MNQKEIVDKKYENINNQFYQDSKNLIAKEKNIVNSNKNEEEKDEIKISKIQNQRKETDKINLKIEKLGKNIYDKNYNINIDENRNEDIKPGINKSFEKKFQKECHEENLIINIKPIEIQEKDLKIDKEENIINGKPIKNKYEEKDSSNINENKENNNLKKNNGINNVKNLNYQIITKNNINIENKRKADLQEKNEDILNYIETKKYNKIKIIDSKKSNKLRNKDNKLIKKNKKDNYLNIIFNNNVNNSTNKCKKDDKNILQNHKNKNVQNKIRLFNNKIRIMKKKNENSLFKEMNSAKRININKNITPVKKLSKSFRTENKYFKQKNEVENSENLNYIEIEEEKEKKNRKRRIIIFNNKKNNNLCSELLRSKIKSEKEISFIPYAKKKEKINKNFHTIGKANGISYPQFNIINDILLGQNNYINIIRDDERKFSNSIKNKKMSNSNSNKIISISPDKKQRKKFLK